MNSESGFEGGEIVPVSQQEPFDYDGLDDKLQKELKEIIDRKVSDEVAGAVWEAVTRFAVEVKAHKNPNLTVDAFCFAAGLYILEGKSITQLAKEHGVTKQALDRRITNICKALGLPPSRGMKSEQSRETYRKIQITKSKLP